VRLHITLIGDVTLRRSPDHGGDAPTPLTGPERVVLAALVLERAAGLDRDGLADLLWPEGLPKTWASALRTYVSRCRAALVAALGPEADGVDPLVRTGGRYAVAMPAGAELAVDLEEAEAALAEARRRLAAGAPREAHDLAWSAAGAMAGPFLAGWSGRWVDDVRARLDEVALGALELASQAALSAGDASDALAAADEAVARAPLRESAQRARLAALGATGNRAEALRAYQRLRRALADEMGVDPAPETEAVYLDLLGPAPRVPAGHPGRLEAGGTVTGPSAQTPFVGRAAELAVLADAWTQAASGARHVVMVTGEAGIGKSRLTAEAARRVSRDGGLVLFGRCDQEAIVPYQPVVEALDALVAAAPADELPAIGDEAMAELAAVLPSLEGRRRPGSLWPGGRGRLFGAVTDLVAATAKERPLLLVLDDLQWADDDTLLLVRHLLRRAGDAPILVVAISRDHDIEPGNRLGDVVHALDRDGWVRRLPLRGLDEDEVRELVARLRPSADGAGGADVARLVAETAGNPFLLTELLRAGAPAGIPAGVVDLVDSRLAGLDPGAVDLLRAGAVAGARFELDLVAAAAGLDDEDAVLDAVDAALASGLVVEESAERYRFPHDILRRTLVAQLSAVRRRALHDRLARAIERLRPDALDEYAAVLAHHSSAGAAPGPAGEPRAVRWARRAAAAATARNAPAEAARLWRQALAHLPAGDAGLAAEVTTDLGVALVADHAVDGVRTLLDGAALARAEGRSDVLGRAALALADAAEDQPELRAEARRLVDEAMAAAQPESPDEAGADPLRHAHLLVSRMRLAADDEQDDGGSGPPCPPRSALETLRVRIAELEAPEYVEQRLRLADELAVLAERADSAEHRVVAAHERADAAATLGDERGAIEALAALAAAAPAGDPFARAAATNCDVARLTAQGAFAEASGALAQAVAAGEAGPALARRHRTLIAWLWADAPPEPTKGDDASAVLSLVTSGQRARARARLRVLVEDLRRRPEDAATLSELGLASLAANELGDAPMVADTRALLVPHADLVCCWGYRFFAGAAVFHLGQAAAAAGEWAEAERHLLAALRLHTAWRARPWVALTQEALATVLEARGRSSDREWIAGLRSEAAWARSHLALRAP
jgi:DNA-binding SARP family transcriptional activator